MAARTSFLLTGTESCTRLPISLSFLSRSARALQPGGWFIVKESVAREANGFYVDRSDASITRTDRHFRRLFDAAGLRVAHAEMQPGLPRVVFPVCMYGLRPA